MHFNVVTCNSKDKWRVGNFIGDYKRLAIEAPCQELAIKKVEDAGLTIQYSCSIYPVSPSDPRIDEVVAW